MMSIYLYIIIFIYNQLMNQQRALIISYPVSHVIPVSQKNHFFIVGRLINNSALRKSTLKYLLCQLRVMDSLSTSYPIIMFPLGMY